MFNTSIQQRSTDNSWAYPGYTAPFGIIIDLQLTVPEEIGTNLYIQRLYQSAEGAVSVAISTEDNTVVAYIHSCTTFNYPVKLSSDVGIQGHLLLSPSKAEQGELIATPIRIHPCLISTYTRRVPIYQRLKLIVDNETIFDRVLTTDMALKASDYFSVSVEGGTASISVKDPTTIEAYINALADSRDRPIKTINHIAPNSAGTIALTIESSIGPGKLSVYSGVRDINKKTAYLDSTELTVALEPEDLIDKHISPTVSNRGYSYLPLDDAYYSPNASDYLGKRDTMTNLAGSRASLIGGTVKREPDEDFDRV